MLAALMVRAAAPVLAQQPADPTTAAAAQRDLQQLAQTLRDPGSTTEQKDDAARRLVSRQSNEARDILADALANPTQVSAQAAAARALADEIQPHPMLIRPLFTALRAGPVREAARALSNYKSSPEVLNEFVQIARDPTTSIESVRVQVIRALGSFVERRSAEVLISLIRNENESPLVRQAAADALAEVSGITEYGQDVRRWSEWWTRYLARNETEFRTEFLARRAARLDQLRLRNNDLLTEIERLFDVQYQATPEEKRADLVLEYLRSTNADVRMIGATKVRNIVTEENKRVPDAVQDQIRLMIGDGAARVRVAVARALAKINDPKALDPLLAQLAVEPEGPVRGALAEALWPIEDIRAVPALIGLLKDPFNTVVRDAARALEELGPTIRRADAALATETAEALREALQRHPVSAGNSELRESLVDAMVPLRQRSLLASTFNRLLADGNGESPEMRRLALKAIGELGDENSDTVVVRVMINDKEPAVREAAIAALGNLPNAHQYAEALFMRLTTEPDKSIRDRAWNVMESIFPHLTDQQLNNYADRFKERNEPQRQYIVLKSLRDKLIQAKNEGDLADVRQNIGSLLLTKLNEPREASSREAAEHLRLAMEYKEKQPTVTPIVIEQLVIDRMNALLGSKQYAEAITFASGRDPQVIGGLIKQEADKLYTALDLDNALKLIRAAKEMNPPLVTQFRNQLEQIEKQVQDKLEERGIKPGGSSPAQHVVVPTTQPMPTALGL